jgi:hypothetical protein
MQTDEQEQTTEICQAAESVDTTTVKEHAELITPHASRKMKQKTRKPKQTSYNKCGISKNVDEKEVSEGELSSSSFSDNYSDLEVTPRSTATNPKDKTIIADHKAIDILCDNLREKGNYPISTVTFSQFLKACRRQKDPKTIAKRYTSNIAGLTNMLEENLCHTKDYNLKIRMKRVIDGLKM